MEQSEKTLTHGWLAVLVGTALLVGGLVALSFPVFLGSYDKYGIQIKCGNGYRAELLQPSLDDQESASTPTRPTTSYVDQCRTALAHRRAWLIPVAGAGALILVPDLVAWARGGSARPAEPPHESSAEPTDTEMHEAALLDRRWRSHRPRPSDTTL
ncbi:hypothetical protein [uncultured Mycobacterium sp.]|uniref:hypothetical protein n=1 Tax=uncultured Mycobacterium sp. TaxID=171292 RepID=UPI0035CB53A7